MFGNNNIHTHTHTENDRQTEFRQPIDWAIVSTGEMKMKIYIYSKTNDQINHRNRKNIKNDFLKIKAYISFSFLVRHLHASIHKLDQKWKIYFIFSPRLNECGTECVCGWEHFFFQSIFEWKKKKWINFSITTTTTTRHLIKYMRGSKWRWWWWWWFWWWEIWKLEYIFIFPKKKHTKNEWKHWRDEHIWK